MKHYLSLLLALFNIRLPLTFRPDYCSISNAGSNAKSQPYYCTAFHQWLRLLLSLVICVFYNGCSTVPYEQQVAENNSANLQTVSGDPFIHKVYVNEAAFSAQVNDTKHRFLHVYIGGDGRPYANGKATQNPTPSNPLLLKLMAKDKQPSIYIGRPCYFNPSDIQCNQAWWTIRRYNEQIVDSLLSALSHYSSRYEYITLIGYSGGGALAMLMAEKLSKARLLVTIAGNLDIFEWTTHHEYTPLMDSVNPAELPPLRHNIIQIHYAGKDDKKIRAEWIKDVVDKQRQAEFHLIEGADHSCCWAKLWPDVLMKIQSYQSFIK